MMPISKEFSFLVIKLQSIYEDFNSPPGALFVASLKTLLIPYHIIPTTQSFNENVITPDLTCHAW